VFDFLFRNNNEVETYMELINSNSEKINLYNAAISKAQDMIAKAISKSEIILSDGKNRLYNENYYRLNIRPNDNETGTDFWFRVVKRLLTMGKCYICTIQGKYFIVNSCSENDTILKPRKYTDIYISLDGINIKLNKRIDADDMIVLKWHSIKTQKLYQKLTKLYDDTLSAVNAIEKVMNNPRFKLKIDAKTAFRKQQNDGTSKVVTREEYINTLKEKLVSNDLTIISQSEGIELDYFEVKGTAKSDDISKIAKEISSECARAFDIPESVFFGNITEKSDATNEFITYAVSPVAEVINDSLNAKLVGAEDYIKGERIHVWLSRFKHVDVIDSAANLEKLRGIGFTLDEIRGMVGYDELHTEFSEKRLYTKNFAEEGEQSEENN